jgi:hypothetical protein
VTAWVCRVCGVQVPNAGAVGCVWDHLRDERGVCGRSHQCWRARCRGSRPRCRFWCALARSPARASTRLHPRKPRTPIRRCKSTPTRCVYAARARRVQWCALTHQAMHQARGRRRRTRDVGESRVSPTSSLPSATPSVLPPLSENRELERHDTGAVQSGGWRHLMFRAHRVCRRGRIPSGYSRARHGSPGRPRGA